MMSAALAFGESDWRAYALRRCRRAGRAEFQWKQEQAKGTFKPDAPVGQAYVVLAMGKMGAFELNYSSDIDIIVFYERELRRWAAIPSHRPSSSSLTQAARALLQEPTADGYVFRVDLRLRPDPGATQVAISVRGRANYYETRARTGSARR